MNRYIFEPVPFHAPNYDSAIEILKLRKHRSYIMMDEMESLKSYCHLGYKDFEIDILTFEFYQN